MGNVITNNIIRGIVILILQVFIFKRFSFGWVAPLFYVNIMIYPLIIVLLPIRTPQILSLGIGFVLGLTIDMFYDSPGVHASATVGLAFFRTWLLGQLEPREGYPLNVGPTRNRFGFPWFAQYAGLMLLFHFLFYFAVETFALAHTLKVIGKTFYTFLWSFPLLLLFARAWNTKD